MCYFLKYRHLTLSIYLSINQSSIYPSIHPFFHSSMYLSVYLSIYLSIMYQQSLPFYCWVVFPCVNIPKLIWFTGWKAFGWLPVCGYYEESCYKHYCIYFCVNIYFQILSQYLVVESLDCMLSLCLLSDSQNISPNGVPFYILTSNV